MDKTANSLNLQPVHDILDVYVVDKVPVPLEDLETSALPSDSSVSARRFLSKFEALIGSSAGCEHAFLPDLWNKHTHIYSTVHCYTRETYQVDDLLQIMRHWFNDKLVRSASRCAPGERTGRPAQFTSLPVVWSRRESRRSTVALVHRVRSL